MSALLMPAWGRAFGALSIFTTSAARAGRAGSTGRPVNGLALPATVGAGVVDGSGRVVVVAASFFPPPEQAAPISATTTTATVAAARARSGRRITPGEATRPGPAVPAIPARVSW